MLKHCIIILTFSNFVSQMLLVFSCSLEIEHLNFFCNCSSLKLIPYLAPCLGGFFRFLKIWTISILFILICIWIFLPICPGRAYVVFPGLSCLKKYAHWSSVKKGLHFVLCFWITAFLQNTEYYSIVFGICCCYKEVWFPPPHPPKCTWFTFLAGHWKDYLSFKFNDIIRQCSMYSVSNISGKQRSVSGYRFRVFFFFPLLGFKEVLSHYIFKFIFSLLVLLHTKDNNYPYVGSHLSVFHTC